MGYAVSKIDSSMFIKHKDYFDSSLINLLEAQNVKIEKLNSANQVYHANAIILKSKMKILNFKNRDINNLLYSFKVKNKDFEDAIKEIKKEIKKEINDIQKEVDNELEKTYKDNTKLHDENETLKKEIARLRRQLNLKPKINSQNSSMAPSTDVFKKPINSREKSNLKVGAQENHEGHFLKCCKKVDKIITKTVKKAPSGAQAIVEDDEVKYYRTQEKSMKISTLIIETRYYINEKGKDLSKEEKNKYKISAVSYSNDTIATVLYLHSKGIIALKRLCEIVEEISAGEITLTQGTIVKWEKRFYNKSMNDRSKILKDIIESRNIHVDETGWKINAKLNWLHVLHSQQGSYFIVTKSRTDKEKGPMKLLDEYKNNLVHDHLKVYYQLLNCTHIECNAHILRYLKQGEFDDEVYSALMVKHMKKMLHERNELMKNEVYSFSAEQIATYEKEYIRIIDKGLEEYHKKNPNIAKKYIPTYIKTLKRMKQYQEEHLKFIHDFNVPFTNNPAEKEIRISKIKAKVSGERKSLETANNFAAILTITQTCRHKKISPLHKISEILYS